MMDSVYSVCPLFNNLTEGERYEVRQLLEGRCVWMSCYTICDQITYIIITKYKWMFYIV